MSRLSGLVLCLATYLAAQADATSLASLPCDSNLRLLFPEYFSHCSQCTYGDWSDWEIVPDSTVIVPVSQCSSGEAYREIRTQTAVEAGCELGSKTETRQICRFPITTLKRPFKISIFPNINAGMPDREDRLIMHFDLGSGGQDYSSIGGGRGGTGNPGRRPGGRGGYWAWLSSASFRLTAVAPRPRACSYNQRICQNHLGKFTDYS